MILASPSWSVELHCGGWGWKDQSLAGGLLSSSAPETAGCSTWGMSRWWPIMAPFNSKASTACWRSQRLCLVRKLMQWWVSWGLLRNVMPTLSSTMLVARQVPSRLRHCGAKTASRGPTWTQSTLTGWGSWRSLSTPLLLVRIGSMAGSSVGAGTKGSLLIPSSLHGGRYRWTTSDQRRELLDWFFLEENITFVVVLVSLGFWTNVTDEPVVLSACRTALTQLTGSIYKVKKETGERKDSIQYITKPHSVTARRKGCHSQRLKFLGFRAQDVRTFEWRCPQRDQNLRLEG